MNRGGRRQRGVRAGRARPDPGGGPVRDPGQPGGERPDPGQGTGPAGEDQEDGLGRVLGPVRVAGDGPAHPENDRGVAADEEFERVLVGPGVEPAEEVGVRGRVGRPEPSKPAGRGCVGHSASCLRAVLPIQRRGPRRRVPEFRRAWRKR